MIWWRSFLRIGLQRWIRADLGQWAAHSVKMLPIYGDVINIATGFVLG
jgi:hypothetical protein